MSIRSTARREITLRAYAMGLSQDVANVVADFLAPEVPVGTAQGKFKSFNTKQAFMVYATARALGGTATRIKFDASDPSYDCTPQALEVPIDDHERELAGLDDAEANQRLEEAKTRTLVVNAHLAREVRVCDLAAAVTAEDGIGNWTAPGSDPIAEVNQVIEMIATRCGMLPNALAFGLGAWRAFISHPKVKADCGVTGSSADPKVFLPKLLNPAIDLRVGVMSRDTVKFGLAKAAQNVIGANCYVFIRSANPTPYDPSWMKTFVTRSRGVQDVRSYRDESAHSDIYSVDWTEDVQLVGSECGARIAVR